MGRSSDSPAALGTGVYTPLTAAGVSECFWTTKTNNFGFSSVAFPGGGRLASLVASRPGVTNASVPGASAA